MVSIAVESYEELVKEFSSGVMSAAPCPWMIIPLASNTVASAASPSGGLKTVNRGGVVNKEVIAEMGFIEGVLIRKIDAERHLKSEYTITELRDTDCKVSDDEGKAYELPYAKLIEYKVIETSLSASKR